METFHDTLGGQVHTLGTGGMAHSVPLKHCLFLLLWNFSKDFSQGRNQRSFCRLTPWTHLITNLARIAYIEGKVLYRHEESTVCSDTQVLTHVFFWKLWAPVVQLDKLFDYDPRVGGLTPPACLFLTYSDKVNLLSSHMARHCINCFCRRRAQPVK